MSPVGLILIFVLQFEGMNAERTFLYQRSGHAAVLLCATASTCSSVTWVSNRDPDSTLTEVDKGIVQSSARAARLSLDTSCSLVINNITAEDAGLYSCRQGGDPEHDIDIYLGVLTISPSEPDADPERDGGVTLECSLSRYSRLPPCNQNSIRWVDQNGAVLLGEGVGYKFLGQTNCVSYLSVKRQSGHNRKYTCRLVDKENNTKIEADYTPVFTGGIREDPPGKSNPAAGSDHTYIIIGAVVGVAVVLVVIAAVLIKHRKRAKVIEDGQKPIQQPDEPDNNVTYAIISHANKQAAPTTKVKEEDEEEEGVTYSTVKTPARTEADNDPSSLYSCVSKRK